MDQEFRYSNDKEVKFMVGAQVIQRFTGDYLYSLVERILLRPEKLYYEMTGNVLSLTIQQMPFLEMEHILVLGLPIQTMPVLVQNRQLEENYTSP